METEGNYVTIVSALNYPLSRGSVHIQSNDPEAAPEIDPRYLSHPLDLKLYSRHVLQLEKLAATEPFTSLIKKGGRTIHDANPTKDLEIAKKILKENYVSNWHVTRTCAMMPADLGGVVDDHLRVYGVRNLRVVDASIFPLIPRGNPLTSVYAVAERAADLIKTDHILKKNYACGVAWNESLRGRNRAVSIQVSRA